MSTLHLVTRIGEEISYTHILLLLLLLLRCNELKVSFLSSPIDRLSDSMIL